MNKLLDVCGSCSMSIFVNNFTSQCVVDIDEVYKDDDNIQIYLENGNILEFSGIDDLYDEDDTLVLTGINDTEVRITAIKTW